MATEDSLARRIAHEIFIRERVSGNLASKTIQTLASLGEDLTFPPGTVIYRAGEPAAALYGLLGGQIDLLVEGKPPRRFRPHGPLGHIEVLEDIPRRHTAVCVTEVAVSRLWADEYRDFLEDHFDFVMAAVLNAASDLHRASLALAPDGGFAPAVTSALPGPMNLAQKVITLRDSGALSGASTQAIVRLASLSREIREDAGEIVFDHGGAAGLFFLVAGGLVEARRDAPEMVGRFGRGDLVCGYGALGDADNLYSARALTPVSVLSLREEDFFDVMEEHFDLARSVLAGIGLEAERLVDEIERRTGVSVPPMGQERP